jgi:uncharacterized membrane protein YoaT (DUF817 family)
MKPWLAILFFITGTIFMIALYQYELLLLVLMSGAAIFALAIDGWKNTKKLILGTLVGGACENLAVFLGAWNYTNANYIFSPIWLPIGWGMSVVLLEEAFGKEVPVKFSKESIALAFIGTLGTGVSFANELYVLGLFFLATVFFLSSGYFKKEEIKMGIMAAIFGTTMETVCIMAGNWHYSAAMFGTPLWLPLCWFNAFLIMRRIIRM